MTIELTTPPSSRPSAPRSARWLDGQRAARAAARRCDTREGFEQHRAWERTLAAGRWGMVTWPEEYGGRGCDLIEWLIFEEEYWRAGAPMRVNQNGIFLLGPTLMEFGTPEQKARFLPRMASGEEIWAQGWSEPKAGSRHGGDPRDRALRDGDDYVLQRPEDLVARARRSPTGCSACSAPTRHRSATAASRSSCCR